ncbi:MAG: DUF5667 domain-containing protein [Anaerolineales bacterium]|jgi:hypothetical protein
MANERRLAQELEACLEGLRAGRTLDDLLSTYPADARSLKELLNVASRLQDLPEAIPTIAFRGAARARFLDRIEARDTHRASLRPHPVHWRTAFALSILTVFLLSLFVGGGLTVASAEALPGDPLYGVKLTGEEVILALPHTPASLAELELTYAELRLSEIHALAARGRLDESAQPLNSASRDLERAASIVQGLGEPALQTRLAGHLGQVATRLNEVVDLVSNSPLGGPAIGSAEQAGKQASQDVDRVLHGVNPNQLAPGKNRTPVAPGEAGGGNGQPGNGQGHGKATPGAPDGNGQGSSH